jgi:hypothetical protein
VKLQIALGVGVVFFFLLGQYLTAVKDIELRAQVKDLQERVEKLEKMAKKHVQ